MSADLLSRSFNRRLKDAIESERTAIETGMLDFEAYKQRTGKLQGLREAEKIFDLSMTEYMKS